MVAGTMFVTRSHPEASLAGPGLVERMARQMPVESRLPIIGIGGITPENLGAVIKAGASGVAVITNILASEQPRRAAEELKQALREAVEEADAMKSGKEIEMESGRA